MNFSKFFVFLLVFSQLNCSTKTGLENASENVVQASLTADEPKTVQVGAANIKQYLPVLKDKTIALVVNQTSRVGNTHLVDSLLTLGVQIKHIFAPEHGFRGTADAGEKVTDGKDTKTGVSVKSLYGKTRKPSPEMLNGVDLVLFDIQDVGARFYTYISSMHYVMEACAEHAVDFMVLDRPNPNGHFVDGPILDPKFQSFVGMHPVPVVHGMTIGEYAQMINGEGWLKGGMQCNLTVIPCANYNHQTMYELPIKPSPNLPDMRSIYLYPSTCFFEGTVASEGRGTPTPFQVYGHPRYKSGSYRFTPVSMPGAKYPKLEGELCHGHDLSAVPLTSLREEAQLNISYILEFYQGFPDKSTFFKESFFDKLAGGSDLRKAIVAGKSEQEIRAGWKAGLDTFRGVRSKYLLYE